MVLGDGDEPRVDAGSELEAGQGFPGSEEDVLCEVFDLRPGLCSIPQQNLKWRHFEADIILCAVRWYLRCALRYRDVEELLWERGVAVDHTTGFRGVQRYAPELDKRCRPLLKATNDSYRVDETYIKVKKRWYSLYRAVDSEGHTLDFMLRATRDAKAAERFFRKALRASPTIPPRVSTVDKHAAYPLALDTLQHDGTLPETCLLRACTY